MQARQQMFLMSRPSMHRFEFRPVNIVMSRFGLVGIGFITSLAIVGSAFAQATRYQAAQGNPLGTNNLGVRYYNLTYQVSPSDVPWRDAATDGTAIMLFDKSESDMRLNTDTNYPVEIRLPFVGSGIDVLQIDDAAGEFYDWEIVGSGGGETYSVVASGSVDTFTSGAPALRTVNLVPQGTLPTDQIHMLRLKAKDTDGLGGFNFGKWRTFIDAFDIYDDSPLTYDDDSNFSTNWTFTDPSLWTLAAPDGNLFEGTQSNSPGVGAKVDIDFVGTSFAFYGFGIANVTGTYTWAVDGGAGGSGTVDQSLDVDYAVRWPELIVNGLSSGPHTLSITVAGITDATQFPGANAYTTLDALAVFDSGIVAPVNNADFNSDGIVDGEDFLTWQRGFGSGSTRLTGDANGDSVVNAADLDIWKSQFGGSGGGAISAVPEPTAVVLGMIGIALAAAGRRRRVA